MKNQPSSVMRRTRVGFWLLLTLGAFNGAAQAQDRLPTLPGYARYQKMSTQIREASRSLSSANIGAVTWLPDESGFEYALGGKYYRYDIPTHKAAEIERPKNRPDTPQGFRRGQAGLERGRQYTTLLSPDKKWKAFYKENNLWLSQADDSNPIPLTKEGSREKRIKFGTGSWVYGEELEQTTAFWWSPDSRRVAFYRFDESQVKDYYLAMRSVETQDTLDSEPYPKAGAPNPIVELYIYNLDTKQTTKADVRDGKPFENDTVGYYVYEVRWSPDGKELLFNRSNRKQNIVEISACNPDTGACRAIVREAWPASWANNHPDVQFLKDGQRFLLISERSGYRNIYLYQMNGSLLATLTKGSFDVQNILKVSEETGQLYYMAHDGDNPMKLQLHRVNLDGSGDARLTDPALNHQVQISPAGKYVIDRAEAHDVAPSVRLLDSKGTPMETLSKADISALTALKVSPPELFTYKAADGVSDCYGYLWKPTNFDPAKKYPLLVSVYAGPETNSLNESYLGAAFGPDTTTELGFLVAEFDVRGRTGRGKKYRDVMYGRMGGPEIDDQAAGVRFLRQRPYVDGSKVGIQGTSYGGYASAMCLLRFPDVFQAACAQSPVTDWKNYDTIYTERYNGLPQENISGYEAGSAMKYAPNLKGRLMLYFGTADNNVHPANTYQLVQALQRAGKSFEVQLGPDMGHTALNRARMLEFFIDALHVQTSD